MSSDDVPGPATPAQGATARRGRRRTALAVVAGGAVAVVALAAAAVVAGRGGGHPRHVTPPASKARAVPPDIVADCSKPADADIARFLATVPDGSTVRFPPNRCYAEQGPIFLNDRRDLTIDGNGSTFRAVGDDVTTCRPNWWVQGGANIVLQNITVYGRNRTGWDGPRPPVVVEQCEHGFTFASTQGGALLQSKAFDVYGDPVSFEPDVRKQDYCAVPPARDIVVDGFEGVNAGRTVGITDAERITIRNSRFADLYDAAVDLEPDLACEYVKNIHITGNRFGRYRFALLNAYSAIVPSDHSGGIEFSDNVTEADPSTCYPPVDFIGAGSGGAEDHFLAGVTIARNQLRTLAEGVILERVHDAHVEGNTISRDAGAGCANPDVAPGFFGLVLHDAHQVNVAANVLQNGPHGGFDGDVSADPASTGLTRGPS